MNSRSLTDRLLSPAGFALALLLFLLPFVTVSCADNPADPSVTYEGSFTGLDLLTGGAPDITYTASDGSSGTQSVKLSGESVQEALDEFGLQTAIQPLAIVAAVVIFVSMVLGLVLPIHLRIRAGAAGALAATVLVVIEVVAVAPQLVAREHAERGAGAYAPHTTPGFGFYLTVAVLLALAVREFLRARRPPVAHELAVAGADGAIELNRPPGGRPPDR
jgi:hypothetical protein